MHTYYQTTLAITGTRSSVSRLEYATDWDFQANSSGEVTGAYERIKQTYSALWEVHPQSSFSSYSETITDVHYGFPPAPPSYPGSGETRIYGGSSSYTAGVGQKSNTSFSSSNITISGVLTDDDSYYSTLIQTVGSSTQSFYSTSASTTTLTTGISTSVSTAVVGGTTGTVGTDSIGTTTSTTRTFSSFYTITTSSVSRTTRINALTAAYTSYSTLPIHLDTILEAEPHERGYIMDGTGYSAGFPADVANSFSKTTLAVSTFQSAIAPMPDTTSVFQVNGIRTTTQVFGFVSTSSVTAEMTRYSADGWWPMTATQTETITRISSLNITFTLDTTTSTLTTVSGNGYEQGTVYSTIHSYSTFAYSVHTNSSNNNGAIIIGHRVFDTIVSINTETPLTEPVSTIGTSTYGTGTFNSYSTQVPNNGQSTLVFQTSSSTYSQSALTSATSSTQFNPSWSELGTLQTSREDYFTSTSLMSSKSSTTTSAIDIFYTTIFGESTQHYQTTRDIRSSRSTSSESGFSYYTVTNSSTDTCNLPPDTITASAGFSGALTTSETYSTLIHNAATTGTQLYTSFSETTYTDTCSIPPGLSTSSGRTSVSGSYVSETYKSITHDAVLIPSSSSTSTNVFYDNGVCTDVAGTQTTLSSTVNATLTSYIYVTTSHVPSTVNSVSASFSSISTNIDYCYEYPPGTETQSGETTNITLSSQTFVTFSHDPLVTNYSISTFTSESTYTETCDVLPTTYTASGATTHYDGYGKSETRSSTFATTVHNAASSASSLFTSSSETTFTETCNIAPGLSTYSGQTSSVGLFVSETYSSVSHNAVLIPSSTSSSSSIATSLEFCFDYPPGTETRSSETTNATLTSQTYASFSHDPLVTYSSASTGTTESIVVETCNVLPVTYTASGATTHYDPFGRSETRSSTFATTVHDAAFVNFNISYNTTSSSFTEVCGISNSLEEQTTMSTADNGLTAHTLVTYYATLHSAPNPHTVTRMTYGTFVTYQTTYGSHTLTSLTSVVTITNSSSAGNFHLVTYRTSVTLSTVGTTYGTHTVTEKTLYSSTIPSALGAGTHTITSFTSAIRITSSSTAGNFHLLTRKTLRTSTSDSYTAPGSHYLTYSTEVTFSTIGTTYGTHTVTEQTYYSSTIPSSVGFGTHTLSWETRVTTTYSSSAETTSLFTSPYLSYVSSSASYSETTITSSTTSTVSVNSTYLGTPTVTLGSTVFTEIRGLTWTRVSRMAQFGDWRMSNVLSESDYPNFPYIYSTRESIDGGVSPVGSWGAPQENLVPSNGLALYFPAFARGKRRDGYSDFYRLSLAPGSSTYSSGASRSTVSYGSGEVLSLSTCLTTANLISITNTFQGVVSFSLTGTSGYYAPAPGPTFLASQSGTGHFGGLPASGDIPGTVVLPPGVWHYTSQRDGTATSEVSTWLTSMFSFTTTVFGLKVAASESKFLRYCSNSYEQLGVAHPATFSIPLYHKGFSTDITYHS